MKRLKKLTALLLSGLMMLSLCAFQVAAEEEEASPVVITDADLLLVEKLEAFGVISNVYEPSDYATRREMADIIAKYIALPSQNSTAESPFSDVSSDDESIGAIKALYDMGIITGDENGCFHPDKNVTYDEALVFIINAVGHKIFAQRSGGYPTGYHRIAIQHDMLDDLKMISGNDEVPVIDIYKMMEAALSASTVETVYYGDGDVQYTLSETETFLSNTHGIKKFRGTVTGNEWTRLTSPYSELTDEQIEIDNVLYDTPGYVYGYFLGYSVDYYLTDDSVPELMYIEETHKANETIRIDSDDILAHKTTSNRIYYENGDREEHIQLVSYIDVIFNSQCYTGYGMLRNILPESGYIEALDNNKDGVYDVLFVYDYKNVVVKNIDTYNEAIIDEITGDTYNLDVSDGNVSILSSENGEAVAFGTISRGGLLSVARSRSNPDIMIVYVSEKSVVGKITSYSMDLGYEINGEHYKVASDYYGDALSVGKSGEFHLDISGKIATYSYKATDDKLTLAAVAGLNAKDGGFDNKVTLRVFTSAGKMEEYDLKEKVRIGSRSYDLTDTTEHNNALSVLCQGYIENGAYKLNDSYVIRFTLDDQKKINYIDMGVNNAFDSLVEGELNNFADHFTSIRICSESIVEIVNDTTPGGLVLTGEMHITRFSPEKVIFVVPAAGDLDDVEGYQVKAGLNLNKYYANPIYFESNLIEGVNNLSAYSFGTSIYPMVDALILRGGGTATAISNDANTSINVVTSISEAANEDGMSAYKLYQGDTALGLLAETVSFTTSDGTAPVTTNYTCKDLVDNNLLKAGDVIQISHDADGCIAVIRVVSEYDSVNDRIIPMFNNPDTFIRTELMINQQYTNFAIGKITETDLTGSRIVAFNAGGYNKIFDLAATPVVMIYDTTKEKVRAGTVEDIQVNDIFTLRTYSGYYAKEIVIFR